MIRNSKQLLEPIIFNQNLTDNFSKIHCNSSIKVKQCRNNFFNSLKLTNQKKKTMNNN